jgi:excisionase family DNA binding protein
MDTKSNAKLLSGTEVADYLDIPARTIDGWRHRGTGPRYIRFGRHVRYRLADVEAWIAANAHGDAA